jgi:hypothetical protein
VSRTLLLLFIIIMVSAQAHPQSTRMNMNLPDSVLEKVHSPKRATIYSAVLPGLGQIYNHKYWKVPVVYAGFGIMAYFIVTNTNNYLDYHNAYIEKVNASQHGNYQWLTDKYSGDNLLSASNYYRRNLEISILLSAVWYIMNILDATVDAHLYTFNINKRLTLESSPALLQPGPGEKIKPGIQLTFKLK